MSDEDELKALAVVHFHADPHTLKIHPCLPGTRAVPSPYVPRPGVPARLLPFQTLGGFPVAYCPRDNMLFVVQTGEVP